MNAEKGEEGGIRAKALSTLCDMCSYMAASIRAKAASVSRLPSLLINLTLTHHQEDLVINIYFKFFFDNLIFYFIHGFIFV